VLDAADIMALDANVPIRDFPYFVTEPVAGTARQPHRSSVLLVREAGDQKPLSEPAGSSISSRLAHVLSNAIPPIVRSLKAGSRPAGMLD
jgi:hypothetical protein